MYPQSPPINPYDPKTLDALREAFDATWVVLQTRDPFPSVDCFFMAADLSEYADRTGIVAIREAKRLRALRSSARCLPPDCFSFTCAFFLYTCRLS